jgi:hypothetical protein
MLTSVLLLVLSASSASATPLVQTASAQPGADKENLICRRETPIGSLIASRKVCLTKAQWKQRELDGNAAARKMVEDGTSRQQSN